MSHYSVTVTWERGDAAFTDKRYSRRHRWQFDGGISVDASSSPHVVPLPLSAADAVDPEEALVAALSSCHLLSFLWIAARRGFLVDSYSDEAAGVLAKNEEGRMAMTEVTLSPHVVFAAKVPTEAEHLEMHHQAHEECFIANSVKTTVRCEPRLSVRS